MIINPYIFGGGGGGGPFSGLVSTTSLVDWWPLDEASGNAIGVHAGLDLTDNNTVTAGTGGPGSSDYRIFTAANNEFFERANQAALQTGDIDFTICGWVYLTTLANGCPWTKMNVGLGSGNWEFYCDFDGTSRFRFQVFHDGATAKTVTANTFGAPSTGTWYWLLTWHDSTANEIGITINNTATDTAAHTTGVFVSNSDFRLGNWEHTVQRALNGRMNRVGYWKRLLTSDEKDDLYNSGNGLDY